MYSLWHLGHLRCCKGIQWALHAYSDSQNVRPACDICKPIMPASLRYLSTATLFKASCRLKQQVDLNDRLCWSTTYVRLHGFCCQLPELLMRSLTRFPAPMQASMAPRDQSLCRTSLKLFISPIRHLAFQLFSQSRLCVRACLSMQSIKLQQ